MKETKKGWMRIAARTEKGNRITEENEKKSKIRFERKRNAKRGETKQRRGI